MKHKGLTTPMTTFKFIMRNIIDKKTRRFRSIGPVHRKSNHHELTEGQSDVLPFASEK